MNPSPEQRTLMAAAMGTALIDSSITCATAAMSLIPPPPKIVRAGSEGEPTIHDCLNQAVQWLDQALSLATPPERAP